MSDARLQVEIGASLQQLTREMARGVQVVERSTAAMSNSTTQVERSFTRLNSTRFTFGESYASASRTLAAQAQRTSTALGGAAASSNRAGQALVDLGRVAQDAPFGFVAIQNNLSPLLESFQRLRTEAGSNGAALRSLAGSLTGPAGIGIALSVVSAGVILYQQYQQRSKKATEEAAKANENYADSLEQVSQANLKGAQNAAKELTELKILYSVTQNANASFKQRIDAVNELQTKYPAYFKNISDEAILAGKAAGAYDLLSASIIATARARASEDLITANVKKQLENEQRIVEFQKQQKDIQKEAQDISRSSGGYNPYGAGSTASVAAVLDAPRKIAKVQEDINSLKRENNNLDSKNLQLIKNINVQIEKGADLAGKVGDIVKAPKAKAEKDDIGSLFFGSRTIRDRILKDSKGNEISLKEKYDELLKQITDGNNAIKLAIEAPEIEFNPFLDRAIDSYTESLRNFNESIRSLGQQGIEYVGTFFSALGEAAASGDFSNFGQGILKAFAGFLGQLGQMFIKQGSAEIAFGIAQNVILPGSGANRIAGGIGMIAAGSLISVGSGLLSGSGRGRNGESGNNAPPVIPQFANGTNFAPGGVSLVGERGPELVNLPRGSQVIPTHKLNSMGGGSVINLSGNLRMSMGELVFELDKERRRQSRQG